MAIGGGASDDESREVPVTEMVEQPAKVMRIGSMIKQLLEEVRAAPLDEASRVKPDTWERFLSARLLDKKGWALLIMGFGLVGVAARRRLPVVSA